MKEGPSVGIEQASLPNNLNAAMTKSYGSERLRKRLWKKNSHVRYMKMNESEPLKKYRKRKTLAKLIFHHWIRMRIEDTCKADYLLDGIKMA